MQTVILGLGNELLGDEGVGVHAARRLQQVELPENTTVVEVGTAILDALPVLEQADRVIVLDAMKGGGPPGRVYKIGLEDCSGSSCIASMHGFDIHRVMALTERSTNPAVMVFGMEPKDLNWSMNLSATAAESLPHLVTAVQQELALPLSAGDGRE